MIRDHVGSLRERCLLVAKVLVVEDSLTALRMVEDLLSEQGHKVFSARDALSAFAILRAGRPDLIILDIGLPGIQGHELCAAIRQFPDLVSTPIIMVTGSHKQIDKRLSYAFGASAYITKPYKADELIEAVNQCLAADEALANATLDVE
jgi:DNA-binding response OmpR family regulator